MVDRMRDGSVIPMSMITDDLAKAAKLLRELLPEVDTLEDMRVVNDCGDIGIMNFEDLIGLTVLSHGSRQYFEIYFSVTCSDEEQFNCTYTFERDKINEVRRMYKVNNSGEFAGSVATLRAWLDKHGEADEEEERDESLDDSYQRHINEAYSRVTEYLDENREAIVKYVRDNRDRNIKVLYQELLQWPVKDTGQTLKEYAIHKQMNWNQELERWLSRLIESTKYQCEKGEL